MIWFGLAVIAAIWVGVWNWKQGEGASGVAGSVLAMSLIGGIFAVFANAMFAFTAPVHPEGRRYCDLQAMGPAQIGGGSLFLGTGYIGNSPAYIYYCKSGAGFRAETIDVRNAWIFETGAEDPHVNVNDAVSTPRRWLSIWAGGTEEYVTEFYVPPGSVERKFKLN